MPIFGFFRPMFSLSRKAYLLCKRAKIFFSRFIFRNYYMEIQGVTRGYKSLQGGAGGYKGLPEVTRGDRGLHWTIETFFEQERSQILFLGRFFINSCSYGFSKRLFYVERQETLFLNLCLINTKYRKNSSFWPKP